MRSGMLATSPSLPPILHLQKTIVLSLRSKPGARFARATCKSDLAGFQIGTKLSKPLVPRCVHSCRPQASPYTHIYNRQFALWGGGGMQADRNEIRVKNTVTSQHSEFLGPLIVRLVPAFGLSFQNICVERPLAAPLNPLTP